MKIPVNILIIEDDQEFCKTLVKALNKEGYLAEGAKDGETAIEMVKGKLFDLIIADVRLSGLIDGVEVVKKIKDFYTDAEIKVIIMTGFADENTAVRAIDLGVDQYIYKPFELDALFVKIKKCLPGNIDYSSNIKKEDKIPIKIKEADYSGASVKQRQEWLSKLKSISLEPINKIHVKPSIYNKNIENLIGSVSVPLGLAGPIKINGKYAKGNFHVPFATTQGLLVQSYHRGMQVATLSGGADTFLQGGQVDVTPVFIFESTYQVQEFLVWIEKNFKEIKKKAEKTTRYGKLLVLKPFVLGRRVLLNFSFNTGDASGLNMINIATYTACEWISQSFKNMGKYYLRSNMSSDKKPSYFNFINSYGKKVMAEVIIPRNIVKKLLLTTPEQMFDFWFSSLFGSIQAGMIATNAHYANGLSAIYVATGQDVAQIVNSSIGTTSLEVTSKGDLYVSVNLPCLIIGTIGGGLNLPHQEKCLEILGCKGPGKVDKLAEIIAASLLGGEISIIAALACGAFAKADIKLRKR